MYYRKKLSKKDFVVKSLNGQVPGKDYVVIYTDRFTQKVYVSFLKDCASIVFFLNSVKPLQLTLSLLRDLVLKNLI